MTRTRLLKALDAGPGAWLCRLLARRPDLARNNADIAVPPPGEIRRLLVIRPGGIGDMLLLLPLLEALKRQFPAAQTDIVCETRNLDVLRLAEREEDALVYDAAPAGFLRRLRGRAYDVAIDSEQFHHFSAVFALLSGAPVRIGFKINPLRNPLYTHLVSYDPAGREALQFLRLLQPLGMDAAPGAFAARLNVAPASRPAPRAVLHVGSSTRYKRWPPERFADVAARLAADGLHIVLIGDKRDRPAAAAVRSLSGLAPDRLTVLTGAASLAETAATIAGAAVFVGPDSGLAHLAAVLGTPTVVLFGPSDPAKWGHTGPRDRIIHLDLPCAPCAIFGYHKPCRTIDCMHRIGVAEVLAAVRSQRGAGGPMHCPRLPPSPVP